MPLFWLDYSISFFKTYASILRFSENTLATALVKRRIECVEVLRIKIVLRDAEGVSKPLIMHYLTLAKEFYRLAYVGVVYETEDVVVGYAGFLLCCYRSRATKSTLAGGWISFH